MGFHLRKSFNICGIRFNLSNSGIGFSTGVKGLRVGIDGKGRSYIGGGKGVLRYRKYINSAFSEETKIVSQAEMSDALRNLFINKSEIILMVICFPLLLLSYLFLLTSIFAPNFEMSFFIFFAITSLLLTLPYKKIILGKNRRLFKRALKNYQNKNFQEAIEDFNELKQNKFKDYHSSDFWLADKISDCYILQDDFESALEFLNKDCSTLLFKEKTITCYYKLERWQKIIEFVQENYKTEEKEEHPSLYALLGEAFLNLGKNEIALETMLQGPCQKRTMNDEMCAYRYTLAKCYEKNGQIEKAKKEYQKVYSYDINYEDVRGKVEKDD